MRSGLPDGLLYWICHGVVRLVSSNGYMLSTAVRSSHRRFIIIIITTTPFEVEDREVGYPTSYDEYMVRYMMGIWYGI